MDGMILDRRGFLRHATILAGAGTLATLPRGLWAMTPDAVLGALHDEELLRGLAQVALEAARSAGAEFADVRIGTGRTVRIRSEYEPAANGGAPAMLPPSVARAVGYGVRVMVRGAWGFAGGFDMTPEGVRSVARAAVTRASATRTLSRVELAPTRVENAGRWETPINSSAFDVAFGDQGDIQLDALAAAASVGGVRRAVVDFGWQETDRVFASTDGSLLVQRIRTAVPNAFVAGTAAEAYGSETESLSMLHSGGYGYEAVSNIDFRTEMRSAAELAVERSKELTPPLSVDVGRYDIVVSGGAMHNIMTGTLARALDAERALGFKTNQGGTSYVAPPIDVLGQMQVASPLVTIRANRSQRHGHATVGWDDEGVAPEDFAIVDQGVAASYLNTRETAAELGDWFARRGESVRSNGCASGAGQTLPDVQLPNLTLAPGTDDLTEDDLVAGVDRGFLIEMMAGSVDHQMLSGQYSVPRAWEIRSGRKVSRISDMAVQFITPQLWRSLDALGGAGSVVTGTVGTPFAFSRHPLQQWFSTTSAVPARFRGVNVLNTGRSA